MMTANQESPRVYVACLASYNAGTLHGDWIEVPETVEELLEAIQAILATSEEEVAEEWAIHDYEGFGPLMIDEYESLRTVVDYAAFIREVGEVGAMLLDMFRRDVDQARNTYENFYAGTFSDLTAFAEDFQEQAGHFDQVPDHLKQYIDFEAIGRDMELNGDIFTLEEGYEKVHVFWNR